MMYDLGPKGWQPLLYLCFTRLPIPAVSDNALALARALLDRGADPNAYFTAGGSSYTPLVGAIGEGEENRPPHPQRDALVRLLLERGAEPYDIQVVYNMGFHGEAQWFLEMIYQRSLQLGRKADWDDPEWRMLDMGGYGSGAAWHLRIAIEHDNVALAKWCLEHGANPNPAPARDKRMPQRSLYEEAIRRGSTEIAELLTRYGAPRAVVKLEGMEAFATACLRLDREEVRSQLAKHPEYLRAPEPMLAAAKRDRVDVVEFLLDLGVSPDMENKQKERPLHIAGYNNALRVAKLLIARGAEIDAREANWANTPLGCAAYYQHTEMIDLLSQNSRDVWELTATGKIDRLRAVFGEEPERARVSWQGNTPMMWLPPEDEALAIEITRLFLSNGADPTIRNKEAMTAADRAGRLGMFNLAKLLSGSAAPAAGPRKENPR
jgi:ankyrin repeat protein